MSRVVLLFALALVALVALSAAKDLRTLRCAYHFLEARPTTQGGCSCCGFPDTFPHSTHAMANDGSLAIAVMCANNVVVSVNEGATKPHTCRLRAKQNGLATTTSFGLYNMVTNAITVATMAGVTFSKLQGWIFCDGANGGDGVWYQTQLGAPDHNSGQGGLMVASWQLRCKPAMAYLTVFHTTLQVQTPMQVVNVHRNIDLPLYDAFGYNWNEAVDGVINGERRRRYRFEQDDLSSAIDASNDDDANDADDNVDALEPMRNSGLHFMPQYEQSSESSSPFAGAFAAPQQLNNDVDAYDAELEDNSEL